MSVIDDRIVRLMLENGKFEKNAQTSIGTLEKLKMALNLSGAAKGLDEIEKKANKINFNSLARAVDTINTRFSAMGIAGMTAISSLTTAALNCGKTIASAVIAPIATGGWARASNIAAARFQIQGLGADWEKLSEDINYGVRDTAYGFDSAARVASQLTASGIEAGDSMKTILRAISGVAAMTNSTYDDIGSIFTTVAGQGKLMSYQLNQLAFRGMNVAAELGKRLGKTEAEIREMVTKGEIDFMTFARVMDEAFGKHATEANQTFTGSLANMKAALSRIGAEFATPFQNSMIKVFNSLRKVIDVVKEKLKDNHIFDDFNKFAEKASDFVSNVLDNMDFSWLDSLLSKVHLAYTEFDKLMTKVESFFKLIKKDSTGASDEVAYVGDQVVITQEEIDELAKAVMRGDYGNGQERVEALGEKYNIVQNRVNELTECTKRYNVENVKVVETTDEAVESNSKLSGIYQTLRTAIETLKSSFSNLKDKVKNAFKAFNKDEAMIKLNDAANGLASALSIVMNVMASIVKGSSGPIARMLVAIANAFLDGASGIGKWLTEFDVFLKESGAYDKIAKVAQGVMSRVANTFANIAKFIKEITSGENPFIKFFGDINDQDSKFEKIGKIVKGLSSLFNILKKVVLTVVKAAFKPMTNILKTVGSTLLNLGAGMGEWLTELDKALTKSGAYEVLQKGLAGVFEKISGAVEKISKWLNGIDFEQSGISFFFNLFADKEKAEDITTVGEGVGFFVSKIGKAIKLIGQYLSEGAVDGISGLVDLLSDLFPILSKLWPLALGGIKTLIAYKGTKAITSLLDTISATPKALNAFTNELNSKALLNAALAIGVLAASLFALSHLSLDQLGVGLTAVIAITAALSTLFLLINKHTTGEHIVDKITHAITGFSDSIATKNTADAIFKVATAFGVLAGSMFLLGHMSWDQFKVAAAAIGIITAALSILIFVINRSKRVVEGPGGLQGLIGSIGDMITNVGDSVSSMLKKIGTSALIISITAFIGVIALAIRTLAKIPFADALKSVVVIGLIFGELMVTLAVIKAICKKPADTAGVASILAALAAAVKILGSVISDLSEVSLASGLKAIVLMGLIFTELLVSLKAISKIANKEQKTIKMVAMLFTLTIVAKRLSDVIRTLSEVPLAKGLKAIGLLGLIFAELAAVTAIVSKIGKGGSVIKLAAFMLIFSAAIGAITASVSKLAELDDEGIARALKAITVLITEMSGVMIASRFMNKNLGGSLKALLPMILEIAAFTAAIKVLSGIDPANLDAATRAITRILTSLSIFSVTSQAFGEGSVGTTLANFGGMAVLLAEVAGIMYLLKDVNMKQLKATAESLAPVMVALGALAAGVGQLGVDDSGLGGFKNTFLEGLAQVLDAGILFALVTGIAAIAGVLNENFPQLKKAVDDGFPLLESIGHAIGGFLGGLVSGVIEPIMGKIDLKGMEDDLIEFIKNLNPLVETVGDVNTDESSLGKLDVLKDLMAKMGEIGWETFKTQVLSSFANADTANTLKTQIDNLVQFLNDFTSLNEPLNNLSTNDPTEKLDILKIVMRKMGFIGWETFKSQVLASWANADESGTLSTQISNLKAFLADFSPLQDELDKLSENDPTTKLDVLRTVMRKMGYIAWEKFKTQVLASFSEANTYNVLKTQIDNLANFITDFKPLQDSLQSLSDDGTEESKLDALKAIINKLGEIAWGSFLTGVVDKITGNNNLLTFGRKLRRFGLYISEYAENVKGVTKDSLNASSNAIQMIIDFANSVPNEGGLFGWLAGDNDIATFGEHLAAFGGSLVTYTETIANVDFAKSNQITTDLLNLVETINSINNNGGVFNTATITQSIDTLGSAISALFTTASDTINDPANSGVLNDIGGTIFNYILAGFKALAESKDENATTSFGAVLVNAVNGTDAKTAVNGAAEKLAKSVVSVIKATWTENENGEGSIKNKFIAVIRDVITKALEYSSGFKYVGKAMMIGLRNGIIEGKAEAVNAAAQAAAETVTAARNAVDMNSPAKKFIEIGLFSMKGLAKGFDDNAGLGADAAERAATATVGAMMSKVSDIENTAVDASYNIYESLSAIYGYINDVIMNNMDVDPKITPVVDLSNIQNGTNLIGRMLGNGLGYSLNLGALSGSIGLDGVVSNNSDVVLAIQDLRTDVNGLSQAISGMGITLDDGTLVGKMAPKMSSELRLLSSRSR